MELWSNSIERVVGDTVEDRRMIVGNDLESLVPPFIPGVTGMPIRGKDRLMAAD